MLIDKFAADWIDTLCQRARELPASRRMYLLLDGVFVPGLHRRLRNESKAILFAALPGCTMDAEDASPFLTPFSPDDDVLRRVLKSCDRWPMVSVIESPESLDALAKRLAAWCVVEADGQRFNFRFPDTRRLSAILKALSPEQRAQITGPAVAWSYIDRDGHWRNLQLPAHDTRIVAQPTLNEHQFSSLVIEGAADEMLLLLADRGLKIFDRPSRSHALAMVALPAARIAQLPDHVLLDCCEWFWRKDNLYNDSDALSMARAWFNEFSQEA